METGNGMMGATEMLAGREPAANATRHKARPRAEATPRIEFRRSSALFSPAPALAWVLGALGVLACVAPWMPRGWMWMALICVAAALVVCYDAFTLWAARDDFTPVLLPQGQKLRGREGQGMQLPIALAGAARSRQRNEVRVAIMAAARESEGAMQLPASAQRLVLELPEKTDDRSPSAGDTHLQLWPWSPEIALLRRGLWPVPRVGVERRSRFGIWRLREWYEAPVKLRIDADLRAGRREMLRSPVYRALVASRETAWTGRGRDFERLREYQPGDTYSEIGWKSTARRGAPVTRLFQWEQKQEVYFVVDQSRAAASPIDAAIEPASSAPSAARAPRRLLDLSVEAALVGATVALELGDEFGLVTYAEEPTCWLRAGSGQFQFHQFRDRLLSLEPLPTTADYEALFANIRLRLRRRAYLVLLADLTERSVADSVRRGVALLRSSHVVLITANLPRYARPAFSPEEEIRTDQDVYAALAGEKENQRLGALSRELRRLGAELRFVPPENFLRTAVEGYLESKREQRV